MINTFLYQLFIGLILLLHSYLFSLEEILDPVRSQKELFNKEEIERLSICLGNLLWKDLNDYSSYYDIDLVLRSIKELSSKERILMETLECSQLMEEVWAKLNDQEAKRNLAMAEEFLLELAKAPGIVEVQPRKLYYKIIQAGSGSKVTEESSPLLHFKESNLSGRVLRDTTKKAPIKFKLAEAIIGFSKGVVGMQTGEKRIIYIHPDLAYGKFVGQESEQVLIFEVELINQD